MADYLKLAKDAYAASETFLDGSVRQQWDSNLRQFQSKHPKGSKYLSKGYEYRSKLYVPRTRSTIRQNEAAVAAAFFSTSDLVNISPRNDNDKRQVASAAITKELVQYRLTNDIPWFLTVLGAFQDTQVQGVCISRQRWKYAEKVEKEKEEAINPFTGMPMLDESGEPIMVEVEEVEVLEDRPEIKLIPVENFRFDPSAEWTDPVNTSPYTICIEQMFVVDVKKRMAPVGEEDKGNPKWKTVSDEELLRAREAYDSTKKARKDSWGDTKITAESLKDFDIVCVHENIMRVDGKDMIWWTLGTESLLTDPVELDEVYHTGRRPYVMGMANIETHKTYPAGTCELTKDLAAETNEIRNQRSDNVRLAMNGRYLIRRNKNIDFQNLKMNIPGSGTMVDDPATDIQMLDTKDVTSSAYAEQDRVAADFDALVGSFSISSMQANKSLNETVGGMQLMSATASQITEYAIRLFAETWVEPVLGHMVMLEQAYESDEVVMAIAADKAKLFERFGISEVTDDLLSQNLTVTVNVGISATNPMAQVQRLMFGLQSLAGVFGPEILAQMIKPEELIPEVFGKLGYKDGTRFFRLEDGGDPRMMQMQQQIEQMQQAIETKQIEEQSRNQRMLQLKQMDQETKLTAKQMDAEMKARSDGVKSETEITKAAIDARNKAAERAQASRQAMMGSLG